MRQFKKCNTWIDSRNLFLEIYKLLKAFQKEETYGVISQIRSAAVSIPTNIAVGLGNKSEKDFSIFLEISFSSEAETEYLIMFVKYLHYIDKVKFEQITNQTIRVKKQLFQLTKKLSA